MEKIEKKWYLYMIRCEGGSLYTGITTDVNRRFEEHKNGKGAKYTKIRKPLNLEIFFEVGNKSQAAKLENLIKKMSKIEKENIILNNNEIEKIKNCIEK